VTAVPGLEEFDGRLLDGLNFCRKAYRLLRRIRGSPGGIRELRLRTTPRAKKLLEEILPLAAFVQSRYSASRTIRVRWMGGNQSFDARVYWGGPAVAALGLPRVRHVEITAAVQPNAHLVRELLEAEGGAFGSEGTHRDPKTRKVVSQPVVEDNSQRIAELVGLIRSRIEDKSAKLYPPATSLVVACEFGSPLDSGDWLELVRSLRPAPSAFAEVVLVDEPMFRVATL
jgi:hypothetical protein